MKHEANPETFRHSTCQHGTCTGCGQSLTWDGWNWVAADLGDTCEPDDDDDDDDDECNDPGEHRPGTCTGATCSALCCNDPSIVQ